MLQHPPDPPATPAPRPSIDWDRIEVDYRAGLLSMREIADQQGVSHTAINKRARAGAWDRDLSAKIHAKAEVLVSRRQVSTRVSTAARGRHQLSRPPCCLSTLPSQPQDRSRQLMAGLASRWPNQPLEVHGQDRPRKRQQAIEMQTDPSRP